LLQLLADDVDLAPTQDLAEARLEQVGTIEAAVVLWDHGESLGLNGRKIPGILEQRPTSLLESLSFASVFQGSDFRTPDLVDGILHDSLYMEAVEDEGCLGHARADGLDVGRGHVERGGLDAGSTFGTEVVEEVAESRGVLALMGPDNPLRAAVDDDGDVLMVTSIRELVDPDVLECVEQVLVASSGHRALDDVADGSPSNPHGCGYRGLAGLLGRVGHVVFEVASEPSLGLYQGAHLDDHAAAWTENPSERVAQRHRHATGVEMSPVSGSTVMNRTDRHPQPEQRGTCVVGVTWTRRPNGSNLTDQTRVCGTGGWIGISWWRAWACGFWTSHARPQVPMRILPHPPPALPCPLARRPEDSRLRLTLPRRRQESHNCAARRHKSTEPGA